MSSGRNGAGKALALLHLPNRNDGKDPRKQHEQQRESGERSDGKYENNKIVIQSEKLNLTDIVIESLTKSRILAERKNIRLILKLEDENPESIFIIGDNKKLLNVFLNLFDNAIKYSNDNSEISCFTGKTKKDGYAFVTIKDEGIGIGEESLKNIFERFYRADSSRTRGESYSLGLGLSIVKAVIEAHGGQIEVKSEETKGSAFTVFLPVIKS